MVVCLYVLDWRAVRAVPASPLMVAGIISSPPDNNK